MDEADILAAEQEGYTFTVNLDHELIAKYRCDRCTAYCTEESRTKSASINNLADLGRLINYVDSCTCIEAG
jgi:Pyruvate/2-oxoacid:ferredoxin oxidoreductase delta subunit